MTTLLSFDTEFSHPVPGIGAMLQFGGVAVSWNPETFLMEVSHEPSTMTVKVTLPLPPWAVVTPWVAENQAALLERCRALDLEVLHAKKQRIKDFIKRAAKAYGEPVIPAGWCIGSDMAYLLEVLGDEHELVAYGAIDLKALVMSLTGQYAIEDDRLYKLLGVDPPESQHEALSDAVSQLRLLLAAMRTIRGRRGSPLTA